MTTAPAANRIPGEHRFISINGLRLHYRQAGDSGPLIVLLHGSFLSERSWHRVIGPLAEHATVVALDRPTCGLTSKPLPQGDGMALYGAEAQADVVAALIAALDREQAILIGNSTGGTVAILTALRHPQRVSALVLIGAMVYSGYATSEVPAPVRRLMGAAKPAFAALMGILISGLWNKAIRKFWHRQERLDGAELARLRGDFMRGPWRRAFLELFLATRKLELDDTRLARITAPALVVTGAHDRAVKPEESRRLAETLPNAQLAVIEDAGHLPHEECPQAFLRAVHAFIDKPDSSTATTQSFPA